MLAAAFLLLFFGSFLLGRFAVAPGTLFRILWDANALQYIRYETMYYVIDCLRARLEEK